MGSRSASTRTIRRESRPAASGSVHQFHIALDGTKPPVWRRVQVPETYSFWDLHVAIQDVFGWQDYHLHEFRLPGKRRGEFELIGIPDEDFPNERPCRAGWEVPISSCFHKEAQSVLYLYDFGDNWEHTVTYEGLLPRERSLKYPRCLEGARSCPPEDCGGIHGYKQLLKAIRNPRHADHSELLKWLGGPFDPNLFSAARIVFDDPRRRWQGAFEDSAV